MSYETKHNYTPNNYNQQKVLADQLTLMTNNQQIRDQEEAFRKANSIGSSYLAPQNNTSNTSGSSGSINASTGDFLTTAKSAQDLAKDMALFQVDINARQGEQDFGFREKEANRTQTFGLENKQADFNNTYALQGQQIGGSQTLEDTRQQSETGRLLSQLQNQKEMQNAEFMNQTNQRSQAASLAQAGFRR